jgi:hypothetical protein
MWESHAPRNLIPNFFSNVGVVIFLGIQISRHHIISENVDTVGNVRFREPTKCHVVVISDIFSSLVCDYQISGYSCLIFFP